MRCRGLMGVAVWLAVAAAAGGTELVWRSLPDLPERLGVAGAFAGVIGDKLVVAGGANFPHGPLWEGGQKVWHDTIYVLDKPDGPWRRAGRLPQPLAYGVSISHRGGLICIGGNDSKAFSKSVVRLGMQGDRLCVSQLPSLPIAIANAAGALVGDTAILAGGQERVDGPALHSVFALNLAAEKPRWQKLPELPGAGRILATAAVTGETFWLIGGASLIERGSSCQRCYLKEVLRYDRATGWKRQADLPRPSAAAPSPAPCNAETMYLLGGDDGTQVGIDPRQHRGFAQRALCYSLATDRWSELGKQPAAMVTAPVVRWRERWVVVSGEVRPGVRSPKVFSFHWE